MLSIKTAKSAQKKCHIDYKKCHIDYKKCHIDVQKCHIDVQNGHFEPVFCKVFSTLTYNNITSNIEQVIFNTPRPQNFFQKFCIEKFLSEFSYNGLGGNPPEILSRILKKDKILKESLSEITNSLIY